ncbi:S-adenosyl-L-methionine-dependent methyltransferase [Crucibulum laeve]|uniref:S-adenosyl-L-methionine-dependent methyltransferase n=1 Tax=Crucibulum laeve TaxID=68775 RepID=A0A5C3MAL9_9AGAR|nr:S-adenosyl-L-methionine-dependent methyltransferase [Crucibulum laeve]
MSFHMPSPTLKCDVSYCGPSSPESDDDSDANSLTFSPPFSGPPSVSSSLTSYEVDPSIRSASPESVLSIGSSLQAQVYRHEYGRGVNNYSEVYRLPGDDEEFERLDKQHLMFIEIMGEKFPPPFREIMADNVPGERKACLDLGCGSGSWIMDVAREFPNCNAVAVDLVPMQSPQMPSNLRSEVDDINLGLEHFYGDFNVVHARLMSSGIKDYHRVIDQISHVLRPGGLIDVAEFDFYPYNEEHQRILLDTHSLRTPWWAQWMTFLASAARARGGDLDAATHLYDWICGHPAFEDVVYREFWLPIVPSRKDSPALHKITRFMTEDVEAFLKSGRPLILGSGLPEDVLFDLEEKARKEVYEAKIPQYTRLQCVYARKKHLTPPP